MVILKLVRKNTITDKFEVVKQKQVTSTKLVNKEITAFSNEIKNLQGFAIEVTNTPPVGRLLKYKNS